MAKVEGLERLKRRLARIPLRIRAEMRLALEQSASELVAFQQRLVAVDDGDLRDTIRKEAGRHELSVVVTAGGPKTTKGGYDYALGVELGTSDTTAQPFFYPPYRASRKSIKSRVTRAMRRGMKG